MLFRSSDHVPLLRNSDLMKKEKTTRPFGRDLSQIPYNYVLGVTNRFKGLILIDKVPDAGKDGRQKENGAAEDEMTR